VSEHLQWWGMGARLSSPPSSSVSCPCQLSPLIHPAYSNGGGGVTSILGCHSTQHPPHEQLLVRLEVGSVLFMGGVVMSGGWSHPSALHHHCPVIMLPPCCLRFIPYQGVVLDLLSSPVSLLFCHCFPPCHLFALCVIFSVSFPLFVVPLLLLVVAVGGVGVVVVAIIVAFLGGMLL
jgi:hypothetical protein